MGHLYHGELLNNQMEFVKVARSADFVSLGLTSRSTYLLATGQSVGQPTGAQSPVFMAVTPRCPGRCKALMAVLKTFRVGLATWGHNPRIEMDLTPVDVELLIGLYLTILDIPIKNG